MQWSASDERHEVLASRGPGPWSRDELIALGWTPRQVERDARVGRLVRVRRGLYVSASSAQDWSLPETYAAYVAGTPGSVVSHESTARVAGLWLPFGHDERVQLTTETRPLPSDPAVRRHRAVLPADEVVVHRGVPFTTVPRTAIDLALGRPLPHRLVVLDSAARLLALGEAARNAAGRTLLAGPGGARRKGAAAAALVSAAERAAGRRGSRGLAAAAALADPRSESPYESWSRGTLVEAGLSPEEVGYAVFGASGRRYFADMAWPSQKLLIEVDGLAKFGTDQRTVRDRLQAERHRQADLEDAGWTVVRWTAGEKGDVIVARVRRALAAAA